MKPCSSTFGKPAARFCRFSISTIIQSITLRFSASISAPEKEADGEEEEDDAAVVFGGAAAEAVRSALDDDCFEGLETSDRSFASTVFVASSFCLKRDKRKNGLKFSATGKLLPKPNIHLTYRHHR